MESKAGSHDIAPDSSRVLILDYGSQYTQLIARRVREAGVYSEIHPHDISAEAIVGFGASGIILSGGPESVAAEDAPGVSDAVISAGNTGALLSSSLFVLGKIKGIKRPTLATYFPTKNGGFILSDVGANTDVKPIHLLQFAVMASVYSKYVKK